MKITDLKCPSCGMVLKLNEKNPNIGECEYCDSRFSLEWDNPDFYAGQTRPEQKQAGYVPVQPHEPKKSAGYPVRSLIAGLLCVAAVLAFVLIRVFINSETDENSESYSEVITESDYIVDGSLDEDGDDISSFAPGTILADFVGIVYGRPAYEVTEEEIARIQWLELKSDIEYRQIGYSFDNPVSNPDAELTWVKFPEDAYDDNALEYIHLFTGLKMVGARQSFGSGQLRGLSLEGISGYFDSMEHVAALVDNPEQIKLISINGNPVSMTGIELFPNLETLCIDSGEVKDERLLVNAVSLKNLSVDLSDGNMDFSVFGMMPWIEELNVISSNLKDIGFVSKMDSLKSLGIKKAVFLTLDKLKKMKGLTGLSVTECGKLKDVSAVSSLRGLKNLELELPYGCKQPDLKKLTGIKELYLKGFDVNGELNNMSKLEALTLDGCTTGNKADFSGLKNLKELKCTSFVSAERDYGFVEKLPSLEKLDLQGTVTYGDISGIFNMKTLKDLNINNMSCEINFDKIKKNENLETLSIDSIKLYENVEKTEEGIVSYVNWDDTSLEEHLDFLGKLKGLKSLSICGNELTELDFASSLNGLQIIDFSDNYVTERLLPDLRISDRLRAGRIRFLITVCSVNQ